MNLASIIDRSAKLPGTVIPGRWGYRRMTHQEYIDFPALSRSLLDWPTMSQMFNYLTKERGAGSEAQDLGTLVHMVTLEPDEMASDRFVSVELPVNPKTGKPYGEDTIKGGEAWSEARARCAITDPGKIVVTPETFHFHLAELKKIRRALHANPEAMRELDPANCYTEVTGIFWHEKWNCWVKFRPDVLPKRRHEEWGYYLSDVKSTRRAATEQEFRRDCFEHGYFFQDVFYAHCHEQMLPEPIRGLSGYSCGQFLNIVLSKADKAECRDEECRLFTVSMDELNKDLDGPRKALFPIDGLGRAEKFVACLREHLNRNPAPDDWAALRKIWPMHEDQPRVVMMRV